jgi:hypothetical protein
MERVASEGTDNEKLPSISVIVPMETLPFTTTLTPGKGSLSCPPTITPFICIFCENTVSAIPQKRNKKNNFSHNFDKLRLTCSLSNDANIMVFGHE